MWDWLKDTADSIGDAISDGWDWVNEQVDTYIYDSGEGQAVVEKWVNDTIDKYIWDTTDGEAVLESWVKDIYNDSQTVVTEVIDNTKTFVDDKVDDIKDSFTNIYNTTTTYITDKTDEYRAQADDLLHGILSFGRDTAQLLTMTFDELTKSITSGLGLPLLDMLDIFASFFQSFGEFKDLVDSALNIDEETLIKGLVDTAKLQREAVKLVKTQEI